MSSSDRLLDVVSCMFALHYFFKTEQTFNTIIESITNNLKNGGNIEAAKKIGALIAERALKAGVNTVVFDRSGYIYHGRVKALADAARESGLSF